MQSRCDAGKYGTTPEPTHVRLVPQRASVESAEPSSAADASVEAAPQEAAVAQPPGSAAASSEAIPEEAAVAESSSSAVASSEAVPEEPTVTEPTRLSGNRIYCQALRSVIWYLYIRWSLRLCL